MQSMTADWFPYTKLQPPQRGHTFVSRARVQRALLRAVEGHKLTLLSAPAGSGKTVLSATLAEGDGAVTWVALDAADNDLAHFVALVATALRSWMVDEGAALFAFLQRAPNLSEKTALLAAQLINGLEGPGDGGGAWPLILILDDYHVIEDATVHQFMAQLLEYLPPWFRLLIATRHDPPLPLGRLRGQGQLAELRLPQLRFNDEEADDFLNRSHRLELPMEQVVALQQQTGGWAAGLQLLAAMLSSVAAGAQRQQDIGRLAPDNRAIFDLLASEVLARQPAALQTFLQQTSILPELTPARCREVTGNDGAAQLLHEVYRRNLFLQALTPDAQSGPFRYHDLFRTFLQEWLKQRSWSQWVDLHRRAAETAGSDEQTLPHLMSAELWDEAAQLLERMAQLDNERRFTRYSVIKGIEALPEAVRLDHPWLLLFVAQHYAIRGQVDQMAPWREQAARRFRALGDEAGEIELLAIDAMVDAVDMEGHVLAFRQKVATVGHLMRPDHWAVYHGTEQWYAIAHLDWPAVAHHTQRNIERALASDDKGAMTMTGLTVGPQMLFAEQGMATINPFVARALAMSGSEDWILQVCALALRSATSFLDGRLDEAEQAGREAHGLLEKIGGLAWIDHHVCWVLLCAFLARRAYHSFDDFVAAQEARWQTQDTAVYYQQGIWYLQGRSYWLRKRTAEAQGLLAKMEAGAGQAGYVLEDEERRALLAALVAMARGETGLAKRHLRRAIELHEKVRHTVMLSHPRLTLATLYGEQNRWSDAMVEFEHVLNELRARQMPGVILQEGESVVPLLRHAIKGGLAVDMLQPLLHILQPEDGGGPLALPHTDDYLTARQSEVLRLLATGATNQAIAATLSVTERTVKAHVTRILAKLGATTRTEAVARARELGII